MKFAIHDEASAPVASRAMLASVREEYGFLPNLLGLLGESPLALSTYLLQTKRIQEQSTLNPQEQQVVMLAASQENDCTYCMGAHGTIACSLALPQPDIRALKSGIAPEDKRHAALAAFTRAVVRQRGDVGEDVLRSFSDAGFERAHVLEVLVMISLKTLSNYANHLAQTPLDRAFGGS